MNLTIYRHNMPVMELENVCKVEELNNKLLFHRLGKPVVSVKACEVMSLAGTPD